jgi:23S rRNA (uracil1939-C5)-methyltransferase
MRDEFMRLTAHEGTPPAADHLPRRFTVTVERLVHGGLGLARTERGIVLVTGMLPGETAEVRATAKRSGTVICTPHRITTTSPARRTPFCPYAGLCGGCDWQHIAYDEQIRIKKEILLDCLRRLGRIETTFPLDSFASPERRYRMRTRIQVDRHARILGFFRRKSNEVVGIDSCPLLVPALDELLVRREAILPRLANETTQIRAIAGSTVASSPPIAGFTESCTDVHVGPFLFPVEGDGFFQSNAPLLTRLIEWVSSRVEGTRFLDLYGGTGLFSLALHRRFERGTLVETSEPLVAKARECFARNGVDTVKALCGSAEAYIANAGRGESPDCVLVDPPRPGLTRLVRQGIRDLAPSRVVYVSCNPATLARDTGFLVNSCGYRIEAGALFDLYPQTHHVEAAVVMKNEEWR